MDTHGRVISFGKYEGQLYTRLPSHYLKYLENTGFGISRELAASELKRRGTEVNDELELTLHAIDKASLITREWKDKGICTWLAEIANEALKAGKGNKVVVYKSFKFVFAYGDSHPMLVTISSAIYDS